jgi:hypothetical protein
VTFISNKHIMMGSDDANVSSMQPSAFGVIVDVDGTCSLDEFVCAEWNFTSSYNLLCNCSSLLLIRMYMGWHDLQRCIIIARAFR